MTSRSNPLVSAIIAVRNEERHIDAVIQSLLRQETYNCELEILVVDGDSSDSTREIVRRYSAEDSRVKLLVNPKKKTPYAFNIGIQEARGEYICILGAHTIYATNYVGACLEELRAQGAGGCSGREFIRPGGDGLQPKLIAWVLGHPFGTSTGSMRTRGAGFADTIPYPIFLKSTLLEVGSYDTRLHRNQDNDLNQRLRARGHKLYITDKTYCEYFVSPTVTSLAKYAFTTGFWNIISFKNNRSAMSARHFVPGAFVLALALSFLTFLYSMNAPESFGLWLRLPFVVLGATYAIASIAAASHVALREKSIVALLMPMLFMLLHISYGVGTSVAIMRNARPPSSEPSLGV